jgi:enoyl-CoA hydratase/carnithine racemase
MGDYRYISYETLDDGVIARITLDRPRTRNAQNRGLLVELGEAFARAEEDDTVRVVILRGAGPMFSSGHDMGSREATEERQPGPGQHPSMTVNGGTRLGMCGVEYFAHPWEFGPRKARELLLTGDSIDVDEAYRLGMVSKVFPLDQMEDQTLAFARRIAQTTTMAALLIKESVNQSVDQMGFYNALNACFTIHQVNHAHWAEINDNHYPVGTPEFGVAPWNQAPPVRQAVKDAAEAPAR